jgi:allantoate deiminase
VPMSTSKLDEWVDELSRIGGDGRAVNRFAWTPHQIQACDWLVRQLQELGLEAEVDSAGNVVGRWQSGEGKAVLIGSHLDTVPDGGRFDGALGVLSALETVRRLKEDGFEPGRPLWLAAFNDEEGTRFGTSMFGSEAFVGTDLSHLEDRVDRDGTTLSEAMKSCGFDFDTIPRACRIEHIGCYLELHIEQGPRMQDRNLDLAVVSGIVGLRGYRVTLEGQTNHAGTTPMRQRRDALVGASQVVLALRQAALTAADVTANVGRIQVEPGGTNVVPGKAVLHLDVRASAGPQFRQITSKLEDIVHEAARAEGLTADIAVIYAHEPTAMDEGLSSVLREEMERSALAWEDLASGAGHDAQVLAKHVPSAMLFVPSRDGISHAPAEYTTPEQREPGVKILTEVVRRLCSSDIPRARRSDPNGGEAV